MVLCFLYGGFAILLFLFLLYSAMWMPEQANLWGVGGRNPDLNRASPEDINRFPDFNRTMRMPRSFFDPWGFFSSPLALAFLVSGVISLIAGMTIWSLVREKEIKSVKQQTANNLLLPDERKVIDALKASDYELTQSKMARETGMSKVQVHRALKRLESKGVIEKHGYGLTNKIILRKEFFE